MFRVNRSSIEDVTDIFPDTGLNPTTWIILSIYNTLIIIIGILGSIFLLYSSFVHQAIKMDAVSLMFVHNMVITDFIWTVVMFVPMFVTLVARSWIMGEAVCCIVAYGFSWPIFNKALTILTFSGRLLNCNSRSIYLVTHSYSCCFSKFNCMIVMFSHLLYF